MAHKGLRLIESANANKYHWVTTKIIETPSILNTVDVVTEANITVGNILDWDILLVGLNERVYISFEGFLIPLYKCFFTK